MSGVAEGTALYRIRGEAALLLYIGVSDDFGRRWNQHAKRQPWWGEMRSLSVDCWYPTRAEAERAERAAIMAERPKHNIVHNGAPIDLGEYSPLTKAEQRALPYFFRVDEAARVLGVTLTGKGDSARARGLPCPVVRMSSHATRVATEDLLEAPGFNVAELRALMAELAAEAAA